MEILKKTEGIDASAKSSELHGSVTIQLKDKTTDKVIKEVKHDNFFTQALADIIGGAPYMQNMQFGFNGNTSTIGANHRYIQGIYNDLLGGIILFPQSLGNSTTDYYQPFTNFPTAYAAMNSYELTDPKQGVFDPTSAAITNGYQYIYNWGPNNGNGIINSVALSNKDCYKYYSEPTINYIPNITNIASGSAGFYVEKWFPPYNNLAHGILAADEDGMVMFGMNSVSWDYYKTLYYIPLKPYSLNLTNSFLNLNNNLEESCLWKYTGTWGSIRPTVQIYEGKIAIILREDGANKPCTIILLNKADGSIYNTITVTWDINMSGSTYRYALVDGYIYASSNNTKGIMYKCSISDPTDVETIELANVGYRSGFATPANSNKIFHPYYIIEDGVALPLNTTDSISSNGNDRNAYYTLAYIGPWVVTKWTSGNVPMITHIDPHYCATKNNLSTPVVKDNTTAMKVTYTVTQQ